MERTGRREFLFGAGTGFFGIEILLENLRCRGEPPETGLRAIVSENSPDEKGRNNSNNNNSAAGIKENAPVKDRLEKQALEPLSIGIYLTIDDAPSGCMPAILENLGENKVVFFVYGGKACQEGIEGKYKPEMKKMLVDALASGNILGNHSFLHHRYSGMKLDDIKNDIEKADRIIEELYKEAGVPRRHRLIRFPYGDAGVRKYRNGKIYRGSIEKNEKVLAFIEEIGYKEMPYTFDTSDYLTLSKRNRMNEEKVIANCRKAADGDIVLCHCIPVTAEKVVPYYVDSNAYRFLLPEPNANPSPFKSFLKSFPLMSL